MLQNRRKLLKFLGASPIARSTVLSLTASTVTGCSFFKPTKSKVNKTHHKTLDSIYSALKPSDLDLLQVSPELSWDPLIQEDQSINGRRDRFGTNCDFTSFMQLEDPNKALLWVNHEYFTRLFVTGDKSIHDMTLDDVKYEMSKVGGSLLEIQKDPQDPKGRWILNTRSQKAFRLDATTTIPFAWPEKIKGSSSAMGTLANCAGGQTDWGTFLTCEENYYKFYGKTQYTYKGHKKWDRKFKPYTKGQKILWNVKYPENFPEHYGWVVEVLPQEQKAQKLIALGRFAHECASFTRSNDGYPVVYMGDDNENECLYKFISSSKNSLTEGTLYVAQVETKKWIPLNLENPILKEHFESLTQILIQTRDAAKLVGGTPLDRPEDIEISPIEKGAVFVALTNNEDKNDYHGHIAKLTETNQDHGSLSFEYDTFIQGGKSMSDMSAALSCPDNLAFDKQGNLWVTTDRSSDFKLQSEYKPYGNNGLFVIPTTGANAGKPELVVTAPKDAELTGPSFSSDGKTLFLSVQHPGDQTTDLNNPTSLWPHNNPKLLPKSAVIQIRLPV